MSEEVPALDNGTPPSADAAREHERSGIKSKKQRLFAILIGQAKERGLTVGELREAKNFRYHHGSSSGLLSTMHSRGILVALTERRGGQTVYVLPEYVNGRETRPYGRHARPTEQEIFDILDDEARRNGWQGVHDDQLAHLARRILKEI